MDSQLDFFPDFNSIRNDSETKICSKCGKEKPIDLFRLRDRGSHRRTECKSCESKLARERIKIRKSTPPPPKDHKCPICEKTAEEVQGKGGKNLGPWVYDHDHKTKKFRGYLCHSCNRTLGGFGDDIDTMLRAIEYLKPNNNS